MNAVSGVITFASDKLVFVALLIAFGIIAGLVIWNIRITGGIRVID